MMTNGINTREMILEILLKIDEEGEHSHIAIRDASLQIPVSSQAGQGVYHKSVRRHAGIQDTDRLYH